MSGQRSSQAQAEGEKMISWRLVFPAVMVAAALAVCFTYFVPPRPPRVEVNQLIPPTVPDLTGRETQTPRNIDPRPSAEEQAAKAFERAAKAILARAPDARASAGTDGPLITGHIPLPKGRPIPRP
jgi:hypothetical protein